MCAWTLARSEFTAAAVGGAAATIAAGSSARAKLVERLIRRTPGICAWNWRSRLECGLNFPVPFRSGGQHSNRMPVRVDQHLAPADMIGLSDEAILLHPLDQPRRAVVADA